MEATLTSPSGKIDTCEIRDLDDSLCQINFTPAEEGVHTISLKFKGIHFAGKWTRHELSGGILGNTLGDGDVILFHIMPVYFCRHLVGKTSEKCLSL